MPCEKGRRVCTLRWRDMSGYGRRREVLERRKTNKFSVRCVVRENLNTIRQS